LRSPRRLSRAAALEEANAMISTARTALSVSVGIALALVAPAAFAQDTTTGTGTATGTAGTGTPAAPAEGALPPPKVVTPVQTQPAGVVAVKAEEDPTSDHEKVIGHIGVGYLGLASLPLAPGNGIPATVNAPVVGVRYWLAEKIGLDLGLGLGITSGSSETVSGGQSQTVSAPTVFGGVIHGGVTLVFAHQNHYKFLLIPEMNIGLAKATFTPNVPPGAPAQPDESHSGFHLDVGARIGAEIHFGFIGVPSLALQATVGAFIRRDQVKTSSEPNGGTVSSSTGVTSFGTSVQSDPWALFANNISAIYYLP
jgi:hypothetical protein